MSTIEENDFKSGTSDARALAALYDGVSDPQFRHGRDLIDLLALRPEDRILDVGCGTGRLAAFAANRLAATGRIIGIDPASSRIEVARRNRDPRMEFRIGSAEDLSTFGPSEFDVVCMNSVLRWLANKPRALTEAYRVLKPNGRLGIATAISDRPNELWQLTKRTRDLVSGLDDEALAKRVRRRIGLTVPGSDEVRALLRTSRFVIRSFDIRAYVSSFEGVAQIIEFLLASTYESRIPARTLKYLERFGPALEKLILEVIPEPRRRNGIQIERQILLVTAVKPV